jgi:hypothetical protein
MSVESDADRAAFFNTAEYAETATFSLLAGVASTAAPKGVFDERFHSVKLSGDMSVDSTDPAFTCAAADVPGVKQGDTVSIRGITYNVVDPQPDGTGLIVLILSKG